MRSSYWRLGGLIGLAACLAHPVVVTEPARVIAEPPSRSAPSREVQWYRDYWRALLTLNVPVAWTLAETPEQRQLAEAIQAVADGSLSDADSIASPLAFSKDTLIRSAARLTVDAVRSARGDWLSLASWRDDGLRDGAVADATDHAGVENWALAFRRVGVTAPVEVWGGTDEMLPLRRSPRGIPMVPVRVNGVVRYFWLDTGSSISILSPSVAAEAGVRGDRDTLELVTAAGRLPAVAAVVDSLQIGSLTLRRAPAMVIAASDFTMRSGSDKATIEPSYRIDGVIGFDIISKIDLTIDDQHGSVFVRRPIVRTTPGKGRPRNLLWFGVPIVTLVSEHGAPLHFSLDTGAEETYGTRTLVAKGGVRGVTAERRLVNGFGVSVSEPGVVVPRVRLYLDETPLVFQRVFLYEAQYPTMFEVDGTLGSDVGRGGWLRIDMRNGRVEVGG